MDTTVAICTADRSGALLETLLAIGLQRGRVPESWELLVVDNGRDGGATAAVLERARGQGFPRIELRLVREERRGLARARNRALAEARGAWLLFADDDVTCAPEWLAAHRAARARESGAVAVGGPIGVRLPPGAPPWWPELLPHELGGPTARLELGAAPFTYAPGDPRPLPFGGNLGLARAAALAAGGFREDLGRGASGPLVTGEETELLERLQRAGGAVLWAPQARVVHRVAAERLGRDAYLAWHRAHGRALVRSEPARSSARRALELGEESWRIARTWLRASLPGPVTPRRAEHWRKLGRAQGRWLELSGR